MKKLLIFILFLCAIAAFAFLPVYAFYITDSAIYQTPLQRVSQWPELSRQGEENTFAKTMFSRKNIYGSRFLSWTADTITNEEGFNYFLSNLKDLCDADVLSQEVYTQIENDLKQADKTIICNKDAMDFKNIYVLFADGTKSANMEINTSTGTVYYLQLNAKNLSSVSLDSFIKYLSLDSFTDWQRFENKTGAYSANAQLYVYVQVPNSNYLTLGVFPMTQEEFKTYK